MGQWHFVTTDIAIWCNDELAEMARQHLDGAFPSYDQLCSYDAELTAENILSRKAEHGLWWAANFEEAIYEDLPDMFLCEVGVYVSWFSESLAEGIDSPCYAAGIAIGYPPRPGSHWPVDEIEDVMLACTAEYGDDGAPKDTDAVQRELLETLHAQWASM